MDIVLNRVEMARVLMERNQYKERFMELQEAVRYDTYFTDEGHCRELDSLRTSSMYVYIQINSLI
jgi:hypothetical protein